MPFSQVRQWGQRSGNHMKAACSVFYSWVPLFFPCLLQGERTLARSCSHCSLYFRHSFGSGLQHRSKYSIYWPHWQFRFFPPNSSLKFCRKHRQQKIDWRDGPETSNQPGREREGSVLRDLEHGTIISSTWATSPLWARHAQQGQNFTETAD